jgi:hypothetical protein
MDASTTLEAWYNYITALQRTFEYSGDLYDAVQSIGPDMDIFLRQRTHTDPELTNNGFCSVYLYHIIVDMCQVMGNPHTKATELDQMIARLRVSTETTYYTLALRQVTREKDELIKSQLASLMQFKTSQRQNQHTGTSTQEKDSSAKTTPSKGKTPCYRKFTIKGCHFGTRCRFDHSVTTLTAAQKIEAREAFTNWNNNSPDMAPYVADEKKF